MRTMQSSRSPPVQADSGTRSCRWRSCRRFRRPSRWCRTWAHSTPPSCWSTSSGSPPCSSKTRPWSRSSRISSSTRCRLGRCTHYSRLRRARRTSCLGTRPPQRGHRAPVARCLVGLLLPGRQAAEGGLGSGRTCWKQIDGMIACRGHGYNGVLSSSFYI